MRFISKEKIAETFEAPKEIALNMPKLYLTGNRDLLIENFKGVIQFEPELMKINSTIGIITITGRNLDISCITDDDLVVKGYINGIVLQ